MSLYLMVEMSSKGMNNTSVNIKVNVMYSYSSTIQS